MTRISQSLAAAAVSLLAAGPALADRPPNAEERTAIEAALGGLGYTAWGGVEWDDDNHWEIDDAVGADGRQYDLDLQPETFEVIKEELD